MQSLRRPRLQQQLVSPGAAHKARSERMCAPWKGERVSAGEILLPNLLRNLRPVIAAEAYAFCVAKDARDLPPDLRVFATLREPEGVTVVAPENDLRQAGFSAAGSWAKISLDVHSSLAAVGLTAAIAHALAIKGISANILAGFYHDHVFVPWERRNDAFDILDNLSADRLDSSSGSQSMA